MNVIAEIFSKLNVNIALDITILLPIVIFVLKAVYKFFKSIGYNAKKIFKGFLISSLYSFAFSILYFDYEQSEKIEINNFLLIWFMLFIVFFAIALSMLILIDYSFPKFTFNYVSYSVKNNDFDDCIWCACTSGQLIKIITKSNEEFIIFPKYSSSYECKITGKKHLRAFILKKGNVNNKGKAEYYEDNTRQILKKLDDLSHKIEKQKLKKIRSNEFLFEPLENKLESSYKCFLSNKPYPKVPFYQILSEFEDRIDFKDIASISIYHPESNNHD